MLLARGQNPKIPIKTLPELNKKIWGLHTKKLTIIGARTSQGKSALALQMAWDVASQGIPTLFISLEMYEEDVIERLFCLVKKVDNFEILTGNFSKHQQKWNEFEKEIDMKPFVITDMLGRTWEDVDKYLNELTMKPKLIIIDHLQEARSASLKNQKEVIEEYLKKLRLMAIRDDFSAVVCSQINRASQEDNTGSEPQIHHLKGAGYLEEGADIIILLHWPWHYSKKGDKNKFILNVAKNRNGRTGWIELKYKPENYWFYEEAESPTEKLVKSVFQETWTD